MVWPQVSQSRFWKKLLQLPRAGGEGPPLLSDKSPFVDEFVKLYHLPPEAVLGYRETLYPEYRKKIKETYVPPPPCTQSCGQAGNFVLRP